MEDSKDRQYRSNQGRSPIKEGESMYLILYTFCISIVALIISILFHYVA